MIGLGGKVAEDSGPIEMLAALFAARDWPIERFCDDELSGDIGGSWATYQLRGVWRASDRVLQVICLPDIRVPDARRAAVHELLALANEQIWLGHFDLWSHGDMLVYRHAAMLGDDGILSVAQAQRLVESAVDECDRFYPAFQFVLWGGKSPREALDAAMIDAVGEA